MTGCRSSGAGEGKRMFDYEKHFSWFLDEHGLDLRLSFGMPEGYGTANGTFDPDSKTVFINAELLKDAPDYEKAFYFFHELRHALQHLRPGLFGEEIRRSLRYVIMYDGTCYKLDGGRTRECRLDGGEEVFTDLYLGQPYEADANAYAYEQAKKLCGASEGLDRLYAFWMPERPVLPEAYDPVYAAIDENTRKKL